MADKPVEQTAQRPMLIGDLLIARNLVSAADVDRALQAQARVGGRLGALLMRGGAISEDVLLRCLGEQLGLPVLGQDMQEPAVGELIQFTTDRGLHREWLLDQQVLVWEAEDRLWYTATDLMSVSTRESLSQKLGSHRLSPCLAPAQTISRLLGYLKPDSQGGENLQMLLEMAEEAPTVELVNNVLAQAADSNASDVHIEPEPDGFKIRLRIDGVLHARHHLPRERFNAVVSRIKLISNIDIAERRLPQDGRFSTRVGGREYEIRVSSLPGVNGESLVLRMLPVEREGMQLERLGLLPDHLERFRQWMFEPHGIVLVTGPTGSGKTTTLYAAIDETNDGVRKIITVEDPVEIKLTGITQVQAHAEIGLTFASALRSILRQDPDVVLVGEIRDLDTAEMAIQASLTGHLVLSTIHTNDAVSAFTRLTDMGIEPFLVATPIVGVQAQRLVRRLCGQCAERDLQPALTPRQMELVEKMAHSLPGSGPADWHRPVGCSDCNQTGYRGRLGIYEMISVTEGLQELILRGASLPEMRNYVVAHGERSMREDGLFKARAGMTTIDEVMRVTSYQEDHEV